MVELLKDVIKQRQSAPMAWSHYYAIPSPPSPNRIEENQVVYFTESGMRVFWRYATEGADDRQILRDYQMALFNRVSVMTMSEVNYELATRGNWAFYHVRG